MASTNDSHFTTPIADGDGTQRWGYVPTAGHMVLRSWLGISRLRPASRFHLPPPLPVRQKRLDQRGDRTRNLSIRSATPYH